MMRFQNRRCEDCGVLFSFKVSIRQSSGVEVGGPWKCPECLKPKPVELTNPVQRKGAGYTRRDGAVGWRGTHER